MEQETNDEPEFEIDVDAFSEGCEANERRLQEFEMFLCGIAGDWDVDRALPIIKRAVGATVVNSVEEWRQIANSEFHLAVQPGIEDRDLAIMMGNAIRRRVVQDRAEKHALTVRQEWTPFLQPKVAMVQFGIAKSAWTALAKNCRSGGTMKQHPVKGAKEVQIHRSVYENRGIKFPFDDD